MADQIVFVYSMASKTEILSFYVKRAVQVWGSLENLELQRIRRDQDKKLFDQCK